MSFSPLVSIVIPVFNGADFLRQAIDSALAQTYPRVEVLVINDGSRDDGATERIVLSYGDRIRYFEKQNGGVASALNLGIEQMRGEYFSWLSHDDVYLQEKIANQIAWLGEHPQDRERLAILYGDIETIDANGRSHGLQRLKPPAGLSLAVACLLEYPLNGCTLLIPRTCLASERFCESLRTTQDYDLFLRLAARFPFVHLESALVQSRLHSGQGTVLIAQHGREANELYLATLAGLSPGEVSSAGLRATQAWGYLRIATALCLKKRAGSAARQALRLTWRHAANESPPQRAALWVRCAALAAVSLPLDAAAALYRWWRRRLARTKLALSGKGA